MVNKIIITTILVLLLGSLMANIAIAAISPTLQTRINLNCAAFQSRINLTITRYDTTFTQNVAAYNAAVNTVNSIIAQMSAAGRDVAKLQADLATWQGMITKYQTDNTAFINALRPAQTTQCGSGSSAFAQAIIAARPLLVTLRTDSLNIKNFYLTTIKPDIQALI